MNKRVLKSNMFLLTAAIIWGFAFVAQCTVQGKIGLFLFVGARSFLGAAALLPIIFLYENKNEKAAGIKLNKKLTVLSGVLCGTLLFTASCLQQWGINISPNAGKAGFITGIYTVLVPIIYFIFFRKKTGLNVCVGAVFAVIGLYFLSAANGLQNIEKSDIILFIGSIVWALHIISIDKFVNEVSPIKFSAIQFLTGGVLGFLFAFLFGGVGVSDIIPQITAVGLPLLYVGIGSSGIAYTCQVLGQRGADPTYSAIILSSESVFAAIGGLIFGIDEMSIKGYIGCFIIFLGILISQINPFKLKKHE